MRHYSLPGLTLSALAHPDLPPSGSVLREAAQPYTVENSTAAYLRVLGFEEADHD